jgi:hypothetical protein
MVNRLATGDEIYEFMMKDAVQSFDESGNLIPGDCNLYYLGCCQKFGCIQLDDKVWSWSFGESSFDTVEAFISMLYQKKLISGSRFHTLMSKIDEGRRIDNMYYIGDYLICKRDGIPWTKKPDVTDFRITIKEMIGGVEASFHKQGYRFYVS